MSDLADILWQQFGTEIREHLDAVERDLGSSPLHEGGERVAALFRAFHSVKGLAAAMGVQSMESIAHSGESLLASVREGLLPLDERQGALLIDVADALRVMSEEAQGTRADVQPRLELARRLEDVVGALRRGGASHAAAAKATDPGIHGDDDRVSALGDRLAGTMIDLLEALRPGSPADALRRLDDDLVDIDAAAGELGLQGLRRQVRRLSRAVHGGRPDVPLLHDLALALGILEELTGRDAGSRALHGHVAQSGAGDLVRFCARAGESLRSGRPVDSEAAVLLEDAARRAELLSLRRSAGVLRLTIDLLRRGELPEEARATLVGVLDRVVEMAAANPPADIGEQLAARLEDMLRALVGGRGVEATLDRARELGVSPALLEHLSDDARARLARVIDDPGLFLVEVDADLDSLPDLATAFAKWVADNADQINSRLTHADGRSRTRVLLATPARPAAVHADLGGLDRSGERLRVTVCDGESALRRSTDAPHGSQPADDTLRVPARLIDDILDRLGELMPVAAGIEALVRVPLLGQRERERLQHDPAIRATMEPILDRVDDRHGSLRRLSDDFARSLKGLRDAALELRVVPVELLFNRYPRLVRELARQQEKDIALDIEPNGARIDKAMIERLSDPLMHMVRNAVDHGIELPEARRRAGKAERARLLLRAEQRGEHVLIEVMDDGRGLDPGRIRERAVARGMLTESEAAAQSEDALFRLVFEPGFSTAAEVTATSGRGVGMDVVATEAAMLGGSVALHSAAGEGTRVSLELPLSVAIQSTLVIARAGQIFALPDRHVGAVARHRGGSTIDLPGLPGTPVVDLAELLCLAHDGTEPSEVVLVVAGARRVALGVERVLRRADVLVKESHPAIAAVPGLGGASRLADGSIVLLLDPDGLIGLAQAVVGR